MTLLPCACCGSLEIDERGGYEICGLCGWEDDPVQISDHDFRGGANKMSLNEARIEWQNNPIPLKEKRKLNLP